MKDFVIERRFKRLKSSSVILYNKLLCEWSTKQMSRSVCDSSYKYKYFEIWSFIPN